METENSRRILDRSREPGLKKPRLAQEPTLSLDRSSNGRTSFMQRPAASGSAIASSKKVSERSGDSERNDSVRGLYPQLQHPHVELVNQYKTALAELTFNSKPIITNLTIIAGESLHAAKGIAAAICSNILEVPSEQKLSSFYLMDSIVKNIGRDYIKYFGSRLPEVFCKAYRQVDPSLHQSMRHLFGTWKGVFPPQPLQAIEKELGFAAAVNKLPSGTSSRVDTPASRPAHSIHVNPKYLEARQRLQQSSKSSQHNQREGSDVLRTKSFSTPFGDSENDSDTSKQSGLEITRGDEKFSGNVRGTVSAQRNGFDRKHGIQNYPPNTKRVSNNGLTSQSTIPTTGSWKNSEEEEYMWDDMNSRVGDHDHATNAARDRWSLDNSEKMSEASADSLSTETNDQTIFGSRGSSPWSQEPPLPDRVKTFAGRTIPGLSESYTVSGGVLSTSSTNGRASFQPKVAPASFTGNGVLSVPLRITAEQDEPQARIHAESRSSQFPGSQNVDPRTKLRQESLQFPSRNIHLPNPRVQSPNIPRSVSATPQLRQQTAFVQHLEPEPLASDLSHQAQEPFSTCPSSDDPVSLPYSGQSSTNDLLAAISGILNSNSIAVTFSHQTSQTSDALTSQANALIPIPSGPTQTQFTSSTLGESTVSLSTSQGVKSTLPSKRSFGHPLPAGSVTTNLSSSSTLAESANVNNSNTPVSSLLSSLVAKGLISASKTESPLNTSYTPAQPQNHSPETTRSGSSQVPDPLASLPISSSYTVNEPSSAKPISTSTGMSLVDQAEMKGHIGFQFKGDVLRVLHPAVISRLFDDFPYKCGVCECRLKLPDQVARHLEWHALRNRKSNSNKASRVWFADSISMLAADAGTVSVDELSGPQEDLVKRPKCTEPMVPADESQCLCILCGELFKDFYDQGMDQWMFKGAVYANVPCSDATTGNQSVVGQDSIVHEKCISKFDA